MMKKIRFVHSFRRRMVWAMTGSLFLVCMVIVGYNVYIYKSTDKIVDRTIANSLELYAQEVDFALDNTDAFLVNRCLLHDTIRKIRKPRKEMDRYLAIGEIQELFWSSIGSYSLMDGLFLYDGQDDIYISQAKRYEGTDERGLIKNSMEDIVRQFLETAASNENEWFSIQSGDDFFLIKMYEFQGVYVGSWVHVDTLLEKLKSIPADDQDYVLVQDAARRTLTAAPLADIQKESGDVLLMDGKKYKMIRQQTEYDAFSFLVLRDCQRGVRNISGIVMQAGIAFILIAGLGMGMAAVQKHLFRQPIDRLVEAMNQLRQGNFNVRLEKEAVFEELWTVSEAFDRMIKEIETLKISVYEEKLQKQNAKIMYLQEQINPHFLTNCLNMIRNLSIMGEEEKVQKAVLLLSSFMRRSLTYSTKIKLKQELEHVRDFEELQKMRYGDQFTLVSEIEEGLDSYEIPTMMIQVFVENSIKHQLDPERHLMIWVRVWCENAGRLMLQVADDGEGFLESELNCFNAKQRLTDGEGEHIGIYNVCQRLELLYGEEADILFSNRADSGAVIDICIPV
ncbi:hypothetical protein D3Z36_09635 [Lachnospiraceae bacterium]|nr:hypothetical protein [Lachnospiraceae bacterium]